jgi:hypothetical protein
MRFSRARSPARAEGRLGVITLEGERGAAAELTGDLPDVPVEAITATTASRNSEAPARAIQTPALPRSAGRRGVATTGGLGPGRSRGGGVEAFGSTWSATWMASCSAADSPVQKSCAVGGSCPGESSAVVEVAALAAAPIGTSSSRGPSQSRGSRTTLLPGLASCPLSAVRRSSVFTGFAEPFLTAYSKSVIRTR